MQFGADKCAFCNIERGEKTSLSTKFELNGLELNELESGETYKYLGQDEDVSMNITINKENVTKEYFRGIKKI